MDDDPARTQQPADRGGPFESWVALVRAREDLGMTRIAFCRATSISNSMMIDLETGRRQGSAEKLKSIADFFGLTVTELKATRKTGRLVPRKPSLRRATSSGTA